MKMASSNRVINIGCVCSFAGVGEDGEIIRPGTEQSTAKQEAFAPLELSSFYYGMTIMIEHETNK